MLERFAKAQEALTWLRFSGGSYAVETAKPPRTPRGAKRLSLGVRYVARWQWIS
jgi:hypothetical protein